MTQRQLSKRLPMVLVEAYDPYRDKTVNDFKFLAQHELDLHVEGEIELSHRDYNSIKRFIQFLNRRQYEN